MLKATLGSLLATVRCCIRLCHGSQGSINQLTHLWVIHALLGRGGGKAPPRALGVPPHVRRQVGPLEGLVGSDHLLVELSGIQVWGSIQLAIPYNFGLQLWVYP